MRGRAHLLRAFASGSGDGRDVVAAEPTLWHDKDLYRPAAIVRAAVLGALRLTTAGRFAMTG